ncbi:LysE family translocator [Bacillus taeanensis]|uniref:Amino acid transporter n=1 Tax=Bacillus taeanensis TaxID=273032 RepID=A0A366XZY4_9BACI|nr:LysE family translocator [Bacillus taeanensis]RBW69713.1 hypothetical protein DS031_09245 [Bacillus taeanensis]
MTQLIGFIVLGLSIAAPIGPINVEIMKRGIYNGFWSSFLVGCGGMSSDLILMFCMYFGLAAFLQAPMIEMILLLLGSVVLTSMGVQSMNLKREAPKLEDRNEQRGSYLNSYLTGAIIAAFNPMNLLFWMGIYGSVLSTSLASSDKVQAFVNSTAVFIGIGMWNLNLAMTVHFGRLLVKPNLLKWISFFAGAVLVLYGIRFGYEAFLKLF